MSTDDTKVHVNLKFNNDFYTENIEPLQHNRVLSKLVSNLLKQYFENEAFRTLFNTCNETYGKEIKNYIDEIAYKKSDISAIVSMFNYIPNQNPTIAPKEVVISTPHVIEDNIITTVKINSQHIEMPTSSMECTAPSIDNEEIAKEENPKAPPSFYKCLESTKNHKDKDINVNTPTALSNNENEEAKKKKPKLPPSFLKLTNSM